MIIYTKSSYSPKKRRKPKGELARKINKARLSGTDMPTLSYVPRPAAEFARQIQSLKSSASCTTRNSVMDPVQLQKETPEVREAIIAKSKRIAIAYSKGAYQYVTDETDAKTIGKKTAGL
jgi:hypothetical protein